MFFGVPIHPLTIHFPIVLFLLATLSIIVAMFRERKFFINATYYLLGLAVLAGAVAILTGRAQESVLVHNEAIHELMELHQTLAYILIGLMSALFIWLYIRRNNFQKTEHISFVIIALAVAGLISYQAHLGGQMVYHEGAGVKPMEKILEQGHQHQHSHNGGGHDEEENHQH